MNFGYVLLIKKIFGYVSQDKCYVGITYMYVYKSTIIFCSVQILSQGLLN